MKAHPQLVWIRDLIRRARERVLGRVQVPPQPVPHPTLRGTEGPLIREHTVRLSTGVALEAGVPIFRVGESPL